SPLKHRLLATQFRDEDSQQRLQQWLAMSKDEIPLLRQRVNMEARPVFSKIEKLVTGIRKLVRGCPVFMPPD
ncbi:unnamed protein product, partial [Amoebophrya sp. A25]